MTDDEILTIAIAAAGLMMKRHMKKHHSKDMTDAEVKEWLAESSKDIENYLTGGTAQGHMNNINFNRLIKRVK